MLIVVVSYCLFSVGTIAYMTFMIAWLAKVGAGAAVQAVFWSLLGFGGICSPFLWSWVIAVLSGGRAIAMLLERRIPEILGKMVLASREG